MKTHPVVGAQLLEPLATMSDVIPIIRFHHEKWDGSGYPDGLVGEEIPYLARVFQVLDIYDALRTRRPYKDAVQEETALEMIEAYANEQKLDPDLSRQFVAWRKMGSSETVVAAVDP